MFGYCIKSDVGKQAGQCGMGFGSGNACVGAKSARGFLRKCRQRGANYAAQKFFTRGLDSGVFFLYTDAKSSDFFLYSVG